MTAVDAATGEVIAPLDRESARSLTERIKLQAEDLFDLAVEAYHGQVWIALGYGSWDEYLTAELGSVRLKLPREERQEQVASLRERGLSLRAIASVTGVGRGTVERDLERVPNGTPDPKPVTGRDGKTYKAKPEGPKTYRCGDCGKGGFLNSIRHCSECEIHHSDLTCPNGCDRIIADRQARMSRIYSGLEYLAQTTDPARAVAEIPEEQAHRIDSYLGDAINWLSRFAEEWKKRHGANQ